MTPAEAPLALTVDVPGVVVGLVHAVGCQVTESPAELSAAIDRAVAATVAAPDPAALRQAVRDMLRHGRYRPTGRGKPASEYLWNAAREGRFPRINTLVDVSNLVSLESLLPVSMLDLDRAGAGALGVRRGRAGEAYVFNAAGQAIELEDLLLVAGFPGDVPLANAVKDSLRSKLTRESTRVAAIVYAPFTHREACGRATELLVAALDRFGGGRVVRAAVIAGSALPTA